jgi:hypothetical protein
MVPVDPLDCSAVIDRITARFPTGTWKAVLAPLLAATASRRVV